MKKIATIIAVIGIASMFLNGCGDSSSRRATKAELRERILEKYSKVLPREQILSMLGEARSTSNSSAAIIGMVKGGYADEFQADLDAYNAAK